MTSPTRAPRTAYTAGIAAPPAYAGGELQRLLAGHPSLRASVLQARSDAYADIDAETLSACDVVFLCLPHGQSASLGRALQEAGTRVVDLGSDFRVAAWTYGVPELRRAAIAASTAVANPGCYATAAILSLAPLAEAGLIDGPVAIDGKSGTTGAGREPSAKSHIPDLHGGITPYQPTGHRHIREIEQELGGLAGASLRVALTPHLLPTSRGLLTTSYVRLARPLDQAGLDALLEARYADEPFVRVGGVPAPQRLAGANTCHVAGWVDERTGTATICGAIDNLVKGAAGQAIQNANLMLGLDETSGLTALGVWP